MGFSVRLFTKPVDESLVCALCRGVYIEPVVTSCGHVYCFACLRLWLGKRAADSQLCPRRCKQLSLEKDVTRLFPLQKLVDGLTVRCVYTVRGCKVVLALRDMLEHMDKCEYAATLITTKAVEGSANNSATGASGNHRASVTSGSNVVADGRGVSATVNDQQPEVNGFSQVLVCKNGCGLPLLLPRDSSSTTTSSSGDAAVNVQHDCVKALQAQVSALQTKLTRSEHDKEKISQRLVKREECMQERFTVLERELRAYQEQTLNYERATRDQRSQITYLRRQLDNHGEQIAEESELKIVLERHGGTLGFNIRGGTEEEDGQCGIYVSKIVENSPASGKLQLFDRILQIDNTDLRNATHQEAVSAFKNAGDALDIVVKRVFDPADEDNNNSMLSSTSFVSIGVQTEAAETSAGLLPAQVTCCRCNGSNRSSQEFSSQGGINFIHQREDSGVDETGEHPSDIELQNGCTITGDILDQRKGDDYVTTYCSNNSNVTQCDDILNKLLLNSSLAALDRRSSRAFLNDMNQHHQQGNYDNAEVYSLSNGYYSGNVSQASLENVKQGGHVENGVHSPNSPTSYEPTRDVQRFTTPGQQGPLGYPDEAIGTDQLYFDSELEYEYEEITIGLNGRQHLGMSLFSGDGEDANSVFVNEVDPRSLVGKDGRVIEGDQILKIHDVAVTSLSDAVDLLKERRDEIKFLVARPVAELQATLLGAESDHGESALDPKRLHLEAFPIGVIEEEDEDEVETVIDGDKCEKDSGVGRTDESLKNDESSEQDVMEEQQNDRITKDQHKAQMDTLGQQIIHFTACASSTARDLGIPRDSPREKSSDEHSQRSGEQRAAAGREGRSSKHSTSSRHPGNNKTSSDEHSHSSGGHERKTGTKAAGHKSQKSSSKSSESPSRSKERSDSKEKEPGHKSEHRRKKDRQKESGESSNRVTSGQRTSSKEQQGRSTGHETGNENGEMKTEWRVRRNKDGSRIFISKKMRPAKQKLLRERAQKLAEERRGLTTDDETQSVYLGRYWSREDRRRQLDKVREARRAKKDEIETERKSSGQSAKRNDYAIIELTQKKMASMERTFSDDFITVDEILKQRNRMGLVNGPVFVTTV